MDEIKELLNALNHSNEELKAQSDSVKEEQQVQNEEMKSKLDSVNESVNLSIEHLRLEVKREIRQLERVERLEK